MLISGVEVVGWGVQLFQPLFLCWLISGTQDRGNVGWVKNWGSDTSRPPLVLVWSTGEGLGTFFTDRFSGGGFGGLFVLAGVVAAEATGEVSGDVGHTAEAITEGCVVVTSAALAG